MTYAHKDVAFMEAACAPHLQHRQLDLLVVRAVKRRIAQLQEDDKRARGQNIYDKDGQAARPETVTSFQCHVLSPPRVCPARDSPAARAG